MKKVFGTIGRALVYTVLFSLAMVLFCAIVTIPPLAISAYFSLTSGWPLVVLSGWCIFLAGFGVAIAENFDK